MITRLRMLKKEKGERIALPEILSGRRNEIMKKEENIIKRKRNSFFISYISKKDFLRYW